MSRSDEIIRFVLEYVKKQKLYPTAEDFEDNGFSYGTVKYHFGSISRLIKILQEAKPEFFKGVRYKMEQITPVKETINRILKELK